MQRKMRGKVLQELGRLWEECCEGRGRSGLRACVSRVKWTAEGGSRVEGVDRCGGGASILCRLLVLLL